MASAFPEKLDATPRGRILGFFGFLLVLDYFLYFRHAGHFFQADSIFLLYHRYSSFPDFLQEFITRHPSGAYRPLSFEILESLFYPIFGLNPIPYRIPVYALFTATTISVYALIFMLTRRHLTAAFATFFFNIHSASGYVTFDITFLPEL